jgi:hypothetical protein
MRVLSRLYRPKKVWTSQSSQKETQAPYQCNQVPHPIACRIFRPASASATPRLLIPSPALRLPHKQAYSRCFLPPDPDVKHTESPSSSRCHRAIGQLHPLALPALRLRVCVFAAECHAATTFCLSHPPRSDLSTHVAAVRPVRAAVRSARRRGVRLPAGKTPSQTPPTLFHARHAPIPSFSLPLYLPWS